jgi:hypothetical protein
VNAIVNFQDIKDRYPGEWLLIGEPVLDPSFNVISGEVLAHSPSRDEIYHQLAQVPAKRVSVEYAGAVLADLVVAV